MIKNKELYEKVTETCYDLQLSYYPKLLLVSIVYRKIRYPKESINEVMLKVTKTIVPEQYIKHKRKKQFMAISPEKELAMLERELHMCENIPVELLNGDIIPNTIEYYIKQVIEKE